MNTVNEWVTISEACRIKRVARNSVVNAIARGDLQVDTRHIKHQGSRIVVLRRDLEDWDVNRNKGPKDKRREQFAGQG